MHHLGQDFALLFLSSSDVLSSSDTLGTELNWGFLVLSVLGFFFLPSSSKEGFWSRVSSLESRPPWQAGFISYPSCS